MADFTVQRADSTSLDLLVPIFDAYRTFYKATADSEGARRFLAERLARNESVIFLACDAGGQALGFTQLYPAFSSTRMRSIWILNDLFVLPAARRRGVGKALLERARQHGLETGACELTLSTATDNVTAQRLYESVGYVLNDQFYVYDLRLE